MNDEIVDYSRKWYVMVAVGTSFFLATIDESIVNLALPTLVRDLNTDFPTVQWVVLAYLLTQTTLMLTVGRLGDLLGKKTIFTAGFIVFTLGSILSGLAPTVYWLVAFRALQAVGAAMALALGFALVTEAFPPGERGKALGISTTIVSLGIVLGPTVGGAIIDILSWRWIFYVNIPVGIVGTVLALRFIPVTKPSDSQQFDYFGAISLFISLLALLLSLSFGQRLGFRDMRVLLLLATWLLFLIVFIAVEWRSGHPLIELNVFKNNMFSINLIGRYITFVAIAGTVFLLPFYLEAVAGYSTRQVGLLLAVIPICLGLSSPLSGILSDRVGTRPLALSGLVALLVGYYALSTLDQQTTTVGYIARLMPIGLGMGVYQTSNNSSIMGAVSSNRLGVTSGLLSVTRTLGQTTGIAILGALWASRVVFHLGFNLFGDVTTAPLTAQTAGLQDAFTAVSVLIAFALALSVWGLVQQWRSRQAASVPLKV